MMMLKKSHHRHDGRVWSRVRRAVVEVRLVAVIGKASALVAAFASAGPVYPLSSYPVLWVEFSCWDWRGILQAAPVAVLS